MSARVGLGLLISGMVALAAWLAVGALGASAAPGPTGAAAMPVYADVVAGAGVTDATPGVAADAAATAPDGADAATSTTTGAAAAGTASGAAPLAGGPATTAPSALPAEASVSAPWAAAVAQATGIPVRAVIGYAGAALALQQEQPSCGLGWNTLAALGFVESGHGTHGGASIRADGTVSPSILGPALDGGQYAAVSDTDAGALDGDPSGDRAVGPMQFIPSTWQQWGADGSGDGVADPQQIDDASLAAARYLCHYGALGDPSAWRTAVFAYNHVDSYVDLVATTANGYAAAVSAIPTGAGNG